MNITMLEKKTYHRTKGWGGGGVGAYIADREVMDGKNIIQEE
jgi:hypothetical protein